MRTAIWILALALVGGYLIYGLATVDRRDDESQIKSMITDTVTAIQKRDLGGTIQCVSKDYKDSSGTNYDRLRVLVAQAFRMDTEYTASVKEGKLTIKGDRATVTLNASVKDAKSGMPIYARNLTLNLRKEDGHHAMVIPTKMWRVTSVDNLGLEAQAGF
ncbi:MAG: hypothetical protein ABFD54_11965 [Armatimonadota bacterium]|nr:hypothetical protein [bacterium]